MLPAHTPVRRSYKRQRLEPQDWGTLPFSGTAMAVCFPAAAVCHSCSSSRCWHRRLSPAIMERVQLPEQPRWVRGRTARGRGRQIPSHALQWGFATQPRYPGAAEVRFPSNAVGWHENKSMELQAEERLSGLWDELWGDLALLLSSDLEGSPESPCHGAHRCAAELTSAPGVCSALPSPVPSPGTASLEVWLVNNTRIFRVYKNKCHQERPWPSSGFPFTAGWTAARAFAGCVRLERRICQLAW